MARDRDPLLRDPRRGLRELLLGAVAHQHEARVRRQVVHELRHPHAVLGGQAELGDAALGATRVEQADLEAVAGRQLAQLDRAVEAGESLVNDRDRLALAEDVAAPHGIGAHADASLPDHCRPRGGRREARAEDAGQRCLAHPHGGAANQNTPGESTVPGGPPPLTFG